MFLFYLKFYSFIIVADPNRLLSDYFFYWKTTKTYFMRKKNVFCEKTAKAISKGVRTEANATSNQFFGFKSA